VRGRKGSQKEGYQRFGVFVWDKEPYSEEGRVEKKLLCTSPDFSRHLRTRRGYTHSSRKKQRGIKEKKLNARGRATNCWRVKRKISKEENRCLFKGPKRVLSVSSWGTGKLKKPKEKDYGGRVLASARKGARKRVAKRET